MRDEKAKLKELSNNISDRSEAKGTGIMRICYWWMAKPDSYWQIRIILYY